MTMSNENYKRGIGRVLTIGSVWGFTIQEQFLLLGHRLPAGWTFHQMERNVQGLHSHDVEDRIELVVRLKAAVAKIEPRAEKQRHWLRVPRPDLGGGSVKDLVFTGHLSDLAGAVV